MSICENENCENEAKYLDPMENKLCEQCMVQSVESDNEALYEHFESIEEAAKQQ